MAAHAACHSIHYQRWMHSCQVSHISSSASVAGSAMTPRRAKAARRSHLMLTDRCSLQA